MACPCSASTPGCWAAVTPQPRACGSCSTAWRSSTSGSAGSFRDGRPERVLPELASELGARAVHAMEDVGPFARRRADAVRRALPCPLLLRAGVAVVEDLASIRTQAGRPYTVFSPFERTWLEEPRRPVLDAPDWRADLPARLRGELPRAPEHDALAEPPPGGEDAARLRLQRFLDSGIQEYADRRDDLGARCHLAVVALPPLGLRIRARGGGAAPARRGSARLPAPALLARLPRPRPAPLPAERALGVPGAVSREHQLEPLAAAVRRVVRGPHRLSARGRRDAPAPQRGLDPQSRPAGGGVVPHQAARHRLAPGRALVHALDRGRRPGEQQRELAVGDVGRSGPAAVLPAPLQPDSPAPHARSGRRLRAPARAGAARRAARTPGRAVGQRRGLPGTHRGSERGA